MPLIYVGVLSLLILIAVTDYKRHIIPDYYLMGLIILGLIYKFLKHDYSNIIQSLLILIAMFLLCFLIGHISLIKKNVDIAGGGDYKLIAVIGFLFGMQGLLFCLILDLNFEFIYRFIVFPERRNAPLPLGASLGSFAIIVLLLGLGG